MVDSVTNKYEFLAVPREKKKRLLRFFELIIPFLLDRTEIMFKSNKQIYHGYGSLSIAYRLKDIVA